LNTSLTGNTRTPNVLNERKDDNLFSETYCHHHITVVVVVPEGLSDDEDAGRRNFRDFTSCPFDQSGLYSDQKQ
jgi:hypothetical protein